MPKSAARARIAERFRARRCATPSSSSPVDESGSDPDYSDLIRKAEGVIRSQVQLRRGFYERNHVDVIGGRATFVDAQCIEVAAVNGARNRFRADRIILATGSRPYRPRGRRFFAPAYRRQRHGAAIEGDAAQHHDLRGRRDRLRVRVDLPRLAHQGEPHQQPRQAARPSSTTKSSTRSPITCARAA